MAKVKLKTSAKLKTSRNLDGGRGTGRSTGRKTGRRTQRDIEDDDDYYEEKSGKGGIVAIILLLVLIGGGGAGGYWYLKMKNQRPAQYVETAAETQALKDLNNKIVNVQLDVNNLRYVVSDANKFYEKYSTPQVVMKDEQKLEFTSPNLEPVQVIKDDAVEGLVSAKRIKLREVAYKELLAMNQKHKNELAVEANKEELAKAEEARLKKIQEEKVQALAKLKADAEALDATKDTVRWAILDEDMFDRSLFKPLEGKFEFNFIQAGKKFAPWIAFKQQAQAKWGRGMKLIIDSAMNTFEILSNSGTDHMGWTFIYEKRKGTLRGITIKEFKIKVVDNIEGVEIPKTLTRPIIDIPPDEFYKLCHKAVLIDKLAKSMNAKKKWVELQKLHPGKSDEQILKFGFASLMYCLKQFPSARAKIQEISEIPTELLSAEIDLVEPTFDRREMKIAMEISQALYDDGKRQDCLMILEKMKERFSTEPSKQWGEYKDAFDALYNQAQKLKKK